MSVFRKVKKYLLILSIFFSLLVWAHITYVYLYDWATKFPNVAWTVSVGFVWNMPSLNPLEFWQNPSNDYILQFLYKSLLKYNFTTRRMEGSLANCDLGKDFTKIKCFIKNNNYWNDWSPITKNDVLATYKTLKETNVNKVYKQMLESIDITDEWDYIEFTTKNADVLILDSFTFPIIKESQIEKILSWDKKDSDIITSGPYVFFKNELDQQYNIKKVTILKRENYWEPNTYISKYIFKFFWDSNALQKNEDSLNIIFEDSNTKKLFVSPRFLTYKYILPQYIWLFLNTEKINNNDLRKFLLFQLENANYSDIYNKDNWEVVKNPFFTTSRITPDLTNKNITSILNSLWYFKRDSLLTEISKTYEEKVKSKKVDVWIKSSQFFITPSNKLITFSTNINEQLISWIVPAWVDWVYVNNYKLTSFFPGNTKFYFNAKKEFWNLKPWANYYTLSFETRGKKVKKETITIYAIQKQADLDKKKQEVLNELSNVKELTKSEIDKLNLEKEKEIKKINELDSLYYYDSDYNKLSLNLEYSWNWPIFITIAEKIKSELKLLWIEINIKENNQKNMEDIVKKWEKNYDMILTWVNHWLFYYNISPFFHSGQAKDWFNFSKIKNVSLDLLLEKLKSSVVTEEKLNSIETESLDVLRREAVVKTFYSPYSIFYIDRNLKNINQTSMFPYSYFTYEAIKNSYIKEDFIINWGIKNSPDLINWIKKHF